jgi:hypothetical protein
VEGSHVQHPEKASTILRQVWGGKRNSWAVL